MESILRFLWSVPLALSILVGLGAMAHTAPALAQDKATAYPVKPAEGLYQGLGEMPGIRTLMTDLVMRLEEDPLIGDQFQDVKLDRLADLLAEQICQLSGGPCTYSGDSMKEVHGGLKITHAHYNRLIELLQASMDAQGVAFRRQNQLLAVLAPMYRDVVTVR